MKLEKYLSRKILRSAKNIRNIETRLKMNRLDDKQMTLSENSSTRSKKHGPKVNLYPDPSSSYLSDSSSSDSAPKIKKSKKKKKRRKHRKDDSSGPSSSDDSDSSKDSHYRRKRRKVKKYCKEDPIRLCKTLTEKLLTIAYKSKILRFKLDEDPLQRRIYFLTFIDSLDMIFSRYIETCEVLLDYPTIWGGNVKDDAHLSHD